MVSERLNSIALMHVHQEIAPDIEKVIDLFSTNSLPIQWGFAKKEWGDFFKGGG